LGEGKPPTLVCYDGVVVKESFGIKKTSFKGARKQPEVPREQMATTEGRRSTEKGGRGEGEKE